LKQKLRASSIEHSKQLQLVNDMWEARYKQSKDAFCKLQEHFKCKQTEWMIWKSNYDKEKLEHEKKFRNRLSSVENTDPTAK